MAGGNRRCSATTPAPRVRAVDTTGAGDAFTGALAVAWRDGPEAYLGMTVTGFPNMFMITGPGSPSVLSNMIVSVEQHVEWIADCIVYLRAGGYSSIEATPQAQADWVAHTTALVAPTVLVHSSCNSWYNGGNVPGKKRMYLGYTAGIPEYRRRCDEIAADGYTGFTVA